MAEGIEPPGDTTWFRTDYRMMDLILLCLAYNAVVGWRCSVPLFLCIEGIPKWHLEVAKLEGLSPISRTGRFDSGSSQAFVCGRFLTVMVASFSKLRFWGVPGYADSGLLLVTMFIRWPFPQVPTL